MGLYNQIEIFVLTNETGIDKAGSGQELSDEPPELVIGFCIYVDKVSHTFVDPAGAYDIKAVHISGANTAMEYRSQTFGNMKWE